jgi:hypothetical protein
MNREQVENRKIWIGNNPELNAKVQDELYALGFKWPISDKYSYLTASCLATDKGRIFFANSSMHYERLRHIPLTTEELLNIKPKETYTVSEEFLLDLYDKANPSGKTQLRRKFPDVFIPSCKKGDRLIHRPTETEYIISKTHDFRLQLTSLTDGNIWTNPVEVKNPYKITNKEMNQLTNLENWKTKFKPKK